MSKSGIMWLVLVIVLAVVAALLVWYWTSGSTISDQPALGSDRDEHGCIGSAGYEWCEPLQKCIQPWEEECKPAADSDQPALGSDRDEHGCIGSAGYEWCESLQKCIRPWEEECK
ncbi:hypothetical protein ACFL0Z_03025 [Patescibacteria group bacterium]